MFINADGFIIITRYNKKDKVAVPTKNLHHIVFYEETGDVAFYTQENGIIKGLFQPNKVEPVYSKDGVGVKYKVLEELVD